MRACIVDDEASCIESLVAKIELFVPKIKVVKTFLLPQEAIKEIPKLDIDVIFLDIEMPHLNGISFAKKINLENTEIIYTTAYQKYAIDAFKVSAFDFLLKPIDRHELLKTAEKLQHKLNERNKLKLSRLNARFNKITVNTSQGILFLAIKSIIYLKSENNYTTLYLTDQKPIVSSRPIFEYEQILIEFDFIRVHQSFLINIDQVKSYQKGEGGMLTMSNNAQIEVSRRKKAELLAYLD
jgi:two-component system, LytTR family, response regulator